MADNELYVNKSHVFAAMNLARSQGRDPYAEQVAIVEGQTYHYLGQLSWLRRNGLLGSHVDDMVVGGVGIFDENQSGKVKRNFLRGGVYGWSKLTFTQVEFLRSVRDMKEIQENWRSR